MLSCFRWYRRWKGGRWLLVYWPAHYNHMSYTEWTQDLAVLDFPFYAQLIREEYY